MRSSEIETGTFALAARVVVWVRLLLVRSGLAGSPGDARQLQISTAMSGFYQVPGELPQLRQLPHLVVGLQGRRARRRASPLQEESLTAQGLEFLELLKLHLHLQAHLRGQN